MPLLQRLLFLVIAAMTLPHCVDAVVPVYQFETGFLLIEGRISDAPGYSEVGVARNEILFGDYTLSPIPGAVVSSVADNGEEVFWEAIPASNRYRAPEAWVAEAGRSYFLRVTTPQGELVESAPEPVPTPVPLENARVRFDQEAYFSTSRNRFIPAFLLEADLQDPAGETNYYQLRLTTYEMIAVCASCERSRWRNGQCIMSADTRFVRRWDYLCDAACWVSSNAQEINVFSDEFSDGRRVTGIEAGRDNYDSSGELLFDVQLFSTSAAAYTFNLTLKGLAEGSGGLNAPLPAALVGNLADVSSLGTNVLGFVGVVSVSQERVFIDQDTFGGTPLPFDSQINLEPVNPSPPTAPCEGGTRTRVMPEGWGE